jgi:hypothetical protein
MNRHHLFRRATAGGVASLVVLAAGSGASAQLFQRLPGTLQDDTVQAVVHTGDRGFATLGAIETAAAPPLFHVIKYKPDGSIDWNTAYGFAGANHPYGLTESLPGTLLAAGRTDASAATFGLALLHLGPAGNVLWARAYRGDTQPFDAVNVGNEPSVSPVAVSDIQGAAGFAIATSITPPVNPNDPAQWGQLLRVGNNGNELFNAVYFDANVENDTFISFTDIEYDRPRNEYVISGTVQKRVQPTPGGPPVITSRVLFVRVDGNGSVIFARTYGLPNPGTQPGSNVWGDGIELSQNGEVTIHGHTQAYAPAAGTVVLRLDGSNGAPIWALTFKEFDPHFRGISESSTGEIGIVGTAPTNAGGDGPMSMLRISPAGLPIAQRLYGPLTQPDFGRAIAALRSPACGWAVVGEKNALAASMQDILFVRTDTQGRVGCFEEPREPNFERREVDPRNIELVRTFLQGNETWPGQFFSPPTDSPILCLNRVACPGDANGDGVVNFTDITVVLANFGTTWPADCIGAGDANGDGVVNFTDVTVVLANFGNTCP